MDLSKAFDCILHDLLIAKLAIYSINDNLILYICLNHKQCVYINNTLSEFNKVISVVPQGSFVGSIFSVVSLTIFPTLLRMLMYITLHS